MSFIVIFDINSIYKNKILFLTAGARSGAVGGQCRHTGLERRDVSAPRVAASICRALRYTLTSKLGKSVMKGNPR